MLTYYSLRIGLVLAAIVPRRLAYWICSLVGTLAFYSNGSARRAVLDNMRHVLGAAAGRRALHRAARSVFRNAVKNYYELLILPRLSATDLERRVHIDGMEHIDAALAGKRGVILCTGHIGNFNLVAQMAGARGYPTNIIAEQVSPPRLYALVNGLRSRFGLRMIPLGTDVVRGIYHALREGEMLGVAADRDLTDTGVPIEFFGEVTELPAGPATLALRLRAPILFVHVRRLANDASIVTVTPPLEFARTGDRERDALLGTERITRLLEAAIREAPDQWVVLQRIWPPRPAPAAVAAPLPAAVAAVPPPPAEEAASAPPSARRGA